MDRNDIVGAKWWKVDFHAHSPGSYDYGHGKNQAEIKQRTPRQWLLDFMHHRIDAVVIADHNSGEWIDRLKNELKEMEGSAALDELDGYHPLVIYPAVEITVSGGTHLLAIFAPECGTEHITRILATCDYPFNEGSNKAVTRKSLEDCLAAIDQAGGIAIPAHIDKANGLIEKLSGKSLQQVLAKIVAAERVESDADLRKLGAKAKQLSFVVGSDSHCPDQVGSRYTWVKMTTPSFEGLKLALTDGSMSLKRFDQVDNDLNQPPSHIISGLTISKTKYCGHAQPLEVKFSPWLNCIIGGRGTGKSSLLEFARLALRRDHELSVSDELKEQFKQLTNIPTGQQSGVLKQDTSIKLTYLKDGLIYRLNWSPQGKEPALESKIGNHKWTAEKGDIGQRFPITMFSQKQIYHMAGNPGALLQQIDKHASIGIDNWDQRCQEKTSRFMRIRAQSRELKIKLSQKDSIEAELKDIQRKLDAFEKSGHASVLKNFQRRRRQKQHLDDFDSTFVSVTKRQQTFLDDWPEGSFECALFDKNDPIDKATLNYQESLILLTQQYKNKLVQLQQQWQTDLTRLKLERANIGIDQAHDNAKDQYEKLVDSLRNQGVSNPQEYGQLIQRRQQLDSSLKAMVKQQKQLDDLHEHSKAIYQELVSHRKQLSANRQHFLSEVLSENPHIKIKLLPYGEGAKSSEKSFRKVICREQGLEGSILDANESAGVLYELYKNYPPHSESTEEFEKTIESLKEQHVNSRTSGVLPNGAKNYHYLNHLKCLHAENIDRLWCWFPEDGLEVSYAVGKRFKPIEQGSPGQKTAAILAFLLSYGDEPIMLDQPEDDLDNHLIYNLIVQQLRENKMKRQLIVITHNPNIVVNGDAEQVIALDIKQGQTQIVQQGGLQEKAVRQEICEVMEGGRTAFKARFKRIIQV